MCNRNMVYTWFKDNGQVVNQLCRCINGFTLLARDFDIKEAYIKHYQNRESAISDGWEYNRNNEWICPECSMRKEG